MTSRSLPIPLSQAQHRSRSSASLRAPSLRAAMITFIAVLILFRWLHLILALQITSTGRQIQLKSNELLQCERMNSLLQRQIAEAESPRLLAERASQLGYSSRAPIYLAVEQPIGEAPDQESTVEWVSSDASPDLHDAFSTWFSAGPAP